MIFGANASGRRSAVSAPRDGRVSPRMTIAAAITTNGSARRIPMSGIQEYSNSRRNSSWSKTPSIRPASAATTNDDIRPSSAAPSEEMSSTVNRLGVMPVMGATRMPTRPASTEASTQLTPAWKSALKPSSVENLSFSAEARVAMPKRVKRNSSHSATVPTTTVPASQNRSWPTLTPRKSTGSLGKIGSALLARDPKRSTTAACRKSMIPTEATTLASTGA